MREFTRLEKLMYRLDGINFTDLPTLREKQALIQKDLESINRRIDLLIVEAAEIEEEITKEAFESNR
jgi:hypothetical protein